MNINPTHSKKKREEEGGGKGPRGEGGF